MKKYIQYIFFAFIAGLMSVSCIQEFELETPVSENDVVTLVPRVQSFANKYVTKAYDSNESRIRSLHILVFDSDGNFAYTKSIEGSIEGASPITINKSMLNNPLSPDKLKKSTLVMIANMSLSDIKNGEATLAGDKSSLTLAHMENYSFYFGDDRRFIIDSDITSPDFSGFPMIGGISNIDLSSTKTQQKAIEVGLKILYAKVNFRISVADEGENSIIETGGGKFSLSSYSVNNISKVTSVSIPVNEGESICDFLGNVTDVNNKADDDTYTSSTEYGSSATIEKSGNATIGSEPISFTFYIAENRYNPGEFTYPLSSLHESYKQQYKPAVASADGGSPEGGNATYVQLNGSYVDYRGKTWIVDYTVYLGKNSYDNFHVDRNSEYTNILTIKGIRNHNGRGESVWFDHRVNVTTDPSKYVTITRETLIDSHIEVRPLRVDLSNTDYAAIQISLPNVDWIAAERFTGINCQDASLYCYNNEGESTGKRRYFTTDLITELRESNGSTIYLLDKECAWIYFDEYTSSGFRSAEITIRFLDDNGNAQGSSETYVIKQQGLHDVGGYYLESYEEYLHSYDSADKYNLSTNPIDYTQQGLVWGYANEKVSQNMIANATDVPTDALRTEIVNKYAAYDYFHESDGESYSLYTNISGSWQKANFGTGLIFTDRAAAIHNIKVQDMGTVPDNAYQYCLSKNKFQADADGNVSMTIHWYLPDAYEMKTILEGLNSENILYDINPKAYYWSSQPSYERLLNISVLNTQLSLINETPTNARAVILDEISDQPRDKQNRIRCVYATEGISVKSEDMADRVPDGIGGNYTFYMTAYRNKSKSANGYFNFLLSLDEAVPKETNPDGKYQYGDDMYRYPTENDLGEFEEYYFTTTDKDNKTIKGFTIDPASPENWTEETKYTTGNDTYYTTLYTYPGLSKYETEQYWYSIGYNSSRELGTPKTNTKQVGVTKTIDFNKSINTQVTLPALQSNMLDIAIAAGNNTRWPLFEYNELYSFAERTYTKYWEVKYPKSKYTTPTSEETLPYTGEADAEATARKSKKQQAIDDSYKEAVKNAKSKALANAKDAANKANPGSGVQPINGTETYKELDRDDDGFWSLGYYKNTCTVRYECTISCKITSTGEEVEYYGLHTGSPWGNETYEDADPIEGQINTDQFKMYPGNAFTITCKDSNYEIAKIKVFFKNGNWVNDQTDYGLLTRNITTYARFVDSNLIKEDGTIASENQGYFDFGVAESISLPGMDYSANSDSGEVWQQWSGSNSTVTLVLADYEYDRVAVTNIDATYTYKRAENDLSVPLVIDRIEVKCTKKNTSSN